MTICLKTQLARSPTSVPIPALRGFLTQLANEPFDLQRQLPVRVYLLTAGPQPVAVLNVHHVVCDGRGTMELLAAFRAYLNGSLPPPMPDDSPSMVPRCSPGPSLSLRLCAASGVRSGCTAATNGIAGGSRR